MLHKLEKVLGLPEDSLTYDEEARKKMVYRKGGEDGITKKQKAGNGKTK